MKPNQLIKLLILFTAGIALLIFSGLALKKVCLPKTKASAREYVQFLSDTSLYSDSNLTKPLFTLPTGYYAEVLSKTDKIARITYNSTNGFIELTDKIEITTNVPTRTFFMTADIETEPDAGTHLRLEPNTTSHKVALIPPSSKLEFIGKIEGTTPTDGTSNLWYYVHFNSGETTTHTGYVYSERVQINSGMETRTPQIFTTETSAPASTPELNQHPTQSELPPTQISSGLKIFLIILFVTLGVIIFALLLISPKKALKTSKVTTKLTPDENVNQIQDRRNQNFQSHDPKPPIPAYNQPEFGEFIDFSQKTTDHHHKSFLQPSKTNSHKRELNFTHKQKNSSTLPPALSRYFTVTHHDEEI